MTIQSAKPEIDFADLERDLAEAGVPATVAVKSTHAVVGIAAARLADVRAVLAAIRPDVRIMGAGDSVESTRSRPAEGCRRTVRCALDGRFAWHRPTRMATESAVTTLGAHPFSTGSDQCLVHNGSLSNQNNLRRELIREGIAFETQNDTEVAAAYLTAEMAKGKDLDRPYRRARTDLDGFFTFVVGTKSGFGVVRDPIAASRRSWLKRIAMSHSVPNTGAGQFAGYRERAHLGAGAGDRLLLDHQKAA